MNNYVRLEHHNENHSNIVVVNWCVGNTCNFSCSYCPEGLHNGSVPWRDYNEIKNFCDKVISHYENKKIYFEFTGGEVSLWKHFIQLAQYLKSRNVDVGLISNGSRTVRWWQDALPHIDHVCLSFHPEQGDAKNFIEIVKLVHKKIRTHVNIMMHPDKFNFCYEVATKVKDIGDISMALQPLIVDFGEQLYEYNEYQEHIFKNQHQLIQKHIKRTQEFPTYRGAMVKVDKDGNRTVQAAHQFISKKENNWQGWKCYIGIEQIVVDMDGTIYRGWCRVGGKIGNIIDDDLQLPEDPILCTKKMCHCNFDIMSLKVK